MSSLLWLLIGITLGVVFDRFFTRVAKWLIAKIRGAMASTTSSEDEK